MLCLGLVIIILMKTGHLVMIVIQWGGASE
jgi:hypothetical protein